MRYTRLLTFAFVAALTAACSGSEPGGEGAPASATTGTASTNGGERKFLLERVDDASVVQLYADGFESLPLREKTLIWHLSQAAIAGRDIYIDQKHRDALAMRGVLEAILTHPQGIDATTLGEIRRYTKLFWINNGPYNNLTARKFVLNTTPQALATAATSAAQAGATFPTAQGESLDALLGAAAADVLRPERRPDCHQQDTRPRQGHPDGEREQPLRRRRDDGGPQGVHREVRPELPARETERAPHRGGLQGQRPLLDRDQQRHPAPRGRDPVRDRADGQRAARADPVVSDR